MRRKSTRNAQKSTPEAAKVVKSPESNSKTRRSRRRKRTQSKSSSSEDEVITITKRAPLEATPDTTTKSHTPSDEDATATEEPIWKVTIPTIESPKGGEIQKLKICLTRPSPDCSPEKTKTRRSKSCSQTEDDATSSEDKSSRKMIVDDEDEDDETTEKKGKGKSKDKNKSNREKSSKLSDNLPQTNNEIVSENVQVTSQSPTIDDNKECGVAIQNEYCKDSDDDQPLSNIKKNTESDHVTDETKPINDEIKPINDDTKIEMESLNDDQNTQLSQTDSPKKMIESEQTLPSQSQEDQKTVESPSEITSQDDQEKIESQSEVMAEIESEKVADQLETVIEKEASPSEEPLQNDDSKVFTESEKIESEERSQDQIVDEPIPLLSPNKIVETSETVVELPEKLVPSSEDSVKVEEPESKPKKTLSAVKLNRDYTGQTSIIKDPELKRQWKNTIDDMTCYLKIDLDGIHEILPEIEFPEDPDLRLEIEIERRKSITDLSIKKIERKVSVEYSKPELEREISNNSTISEAEDNSNIIAFNRKISIVDDTASKLRPPPSPAKNTISSILYVTNLVRPFTVKQLKELLERTGKIDNDGFWTDRIKSKCYVKYDSQEEAEATRNALHKVQWPIGNGKNLLIDYATEEDMELARNPPAPPPVPVVLPVVSKENMEPAQDQAVEEEKRPKESDKKKIDGPVREWDIGKKDVRHERSRSREKSRKHRRTPSPKEDFIRRKQRKIEEPTPQKLMDDLFLKTQATPSIYWQPLSPDEIAMKQQQRLIRMEEHKRRLEENSRMKYREMGRGAFRRRYD